MLITRIAIYWLNEWWSQKQVLPKKMVKAKRVKFLLAWLVPCSHVISCASQLYRLTWLDKSINLCGKWYVDIFCQKEACISTLFYFVTSCIPQKNASLSKKRGMHFLSVSFSGLGLIFFCVNKTCEARCFFQVSLLDSN